MRKELDKNWIWNKLTPFLLSIVVVACSIIYGNRKRASLNENAAYTIGVTNKTYWTAASGQWVVYKYSIEGIQYTGNSRYHEKTVVPDGRYYVKFDRKDYSISVLLQENVVSNGIKVAPLSGWERIPE